MKKSLSLLTIAALGPLIWLSGKSGWDAIPRDACRWRDQDFCSDYGQLYWSICGLLVLGLLVALSVINRRRQG